MNRLSSCCMLAVFMFHASASAQRPLSPLDTSSPRATLSQFLDSADGIGRAARDYRKSPSRETFLKMARSFFSKMQITNFSKRDRMLLKTTLGLRYETTPDQLRHLLTRMRELLVAHPRILKEPMRVRFVGFGDCSLNVELFACASTPDFSEFLGIQEDIFLRIIDLVEASGTGFAFPSQTLYLSRDTGLDLQKKVAAEAEVEAWRTRQELPFPNLDPARIACLKDSLAWPPAGAKR